MTWILVLWINAASVIVVPVSYTTAGDCQKAGVKFVKDSSAFDGVGFSCIPGPERHGRSVEEAIPGDQ
jgi:hypothetical protein